MTPLDRVLVALERGTGKMVRRRGAGWIAHCPAHADAEPSLSVKEKRDGKVLLHCFAGCTVHRIVEAIGLTTEDLKPPRFVI